MPMGTVASTCYELKILNRLGFIALEAIVPDYNEYNARIKNRARCRLAQNCTWSPK
jgi:hypothetical protein